MIAGNHEFTFDLERENELKEIKIQSKNYSGLDINADQKEVKSQLKHCIYLED